MDQESQKGWSSWFISEPRGISWGAWGWRIILRWLLHSLTCVASWCSLASLSLHLDFILQASSCAWSFSQGKQTLYTVVQGYKRECFMGWAIEASSHLKPGPSTTSTASLLYIMLLAKQSHTLPGVKRKGHRLHLSWEEWQRMCDLLNLCR